ncbi:MAG: phosphopyruvate hydratase [Candidatus Uhrbacteria bacterium]|nr:phosphopyruvate hydratase [Candidatus Uhrbacteria bacterium]
MKIKKVFGSEILDSRGNPTVRATVQLTSGAMGTASVPSGASTGRHEVLELRDGNPKRYDGKGVLKAVAHVNTTIARAVVGIDNQRTLDDRMCTLDGTGNKKRLGANAILAVSLAFAHAQASEQKMPLYAWIRSLSSMPYKNYSLPIPMMNIENGGAHAGWILDFQEFMIVPQQKMFCERVRCGAEIFHAYGALLKKKGFSTLVGDEGGYAVAFKKNEDAFKAIMQAISKTPYVAGKDVMLAMDPATSEFYDPKKKEYSLAVEKKKLSSDQMIALWKSWRKKYPIISIEDGLAEDDWDGWIKMTQTLGGELLLVGDDLFVTNPKRLQYGIDRKAANAILIKLNQIGTLSETLDCIALARSHGYAVVVSHRSAETADTTLADLAVAVNAEYIKTGSLSRSERVEKYNRLMDIERELLSR